MQQYVGLDVSQKETAVYVIDDALVWLAGLRYAMLGSARGDHLCAMRVYR